MSLTATELRARQRVIGGTDVAALLGLSAYRTAHDVYLEKVGLAPPRDDSAPMEWGRLLEAVVARKYARETGYRIKRPQPRLIVSDTRPWMGGSPDRLVLNASRVMDAKTASVRQAHKWGEAGTDEIPIEYLIQAHWYIALLDVEACDVAALLGGQDFRIYTVPRDAEFEGTLIERAEAFWRDHIEPQVPPELDWTASSTRLVEALHPRETADLRHAAPADQVVADQYREARKLRLDAERRVDLLENQLKALIGDHAGLQGPGWRITWKATKPAVHIDWKTAYQDLENLVLGQATARDADRDLATLIKARFERFATMRPGTRRFYPDAYFRSSEEDPS